MELPSYCPRAAQRLPSAQGDVRKRLAKVLTYREDIALSDRPATFTGAPPHHGAPRASEQRNVAKRPRKVLT
jgi:hypothetical protein